MWRFVESNWRIIAVCFLILMLAVTARMSRTNYDRALLAENNLEISQAKVKYIQARQRDVAELDKKYTRELADAQKTISDLRRDVDSGVKRLRLAATCDHLPATSGAASVDDAAGAELTDAAQRDYFTLRERIETSGKMIAGLQDYIRQQCR